jgi:putative copper export protein
VDPVSLFLAVSHPDISWGERFLVVGAVMLLIGLANRFSLRNKSKEDRDRANQSIGTEKLFWALFVGPGLMIVGLIYLVLAVA